MSAHAWIFPSSPTITKKKPRAKAATAPASHSNPVSVRPVSMGDKRRCDFTVPTAQLRKDCHLPKRRGRRSILVGADQRNPPPQLPAFGRGIAQEQRLYGHRLDAIDELFGHQGQSIVFSGR